MKPQLSKVLSHRLFWLSVIGFGILILAAESTHLKGLTRSYPQSLIGFALILLIVIVYKEAHTAKALRDYDPELASLTEGPHTARVNTLAFALVWLAYPIALSTAGFIASTTVAVAICLRLVRVKNWGVIVGTAVFFSLILSVLITTALYIPTPSGPIDDLLTRILYAIQGH